MFFLPLNKLKNPFHLFKSLKTFFNKYFFYINHNVMFNSECNIYVDDYNCNHFVTKLQNYNNLSLNSKYKLYKDYTSYLLNDSCTILHDNYFSSKTIIYAKCHLSSNFYLFFDKDSCLFTGY